MPSPFRDKDANQLSWSQAQKKILNRFASYGLDFLVFFLWYFVSYVPLHWYRLFWYRLAGVSIGPKSTIHVGARMYQPRGIRIGTGTIIGDHAVLDGRAQLTIGSHVDIASEVMIYNSHHDIHHPGFVPVSKPVSIDDYVFIGPRAVILPGVTLGKGAVVAAGAVVTKSVAAHTIVAGVPAKPIGQRRHQDYHYRLGRFRLFQ